MKILQIIHCFPPESMTGAEIYTYNLSRRLARDHEVSVFYRVNRPERKEYEVAKERYENLDVYKINNTLKNSASLSAIYENKKIEDAFLKVLDEVKPDIAHIHHLLFLSTGIISILKNRGIPVIFTLHDYWLVCPRGQLLRSNLEICKDPLNANCMYCLGSSLNPKNLIKKIPRFLRQIRSSGDARSRLKDICKDVDLFISPSRFLRDRFIGFGIPSEKITYSDNGMDLSLFEDRVKVKTDKIRFGFIGTLIPSKGAHVLIKAFDKIKNDKAMLKIYGKSPVNNGIFDYYHRIKRMAKKNKNISFMGSYDNRDVAKVFKEIDVLVFPSIWWENSPLVLHEAIITNTPVIASDVGGVSELIKDGRTGLLFESGNENELYEKMLSFIKQKDLLDKFFFEGAVKDIEANYLELQEIYKRTVICA